MAYQISRSNNIFWKINNATEALAAGKAESEVFIKKGFEWKASFHAKPSKQLKKLDFTLSCERQRAGKWRSKMHIDFNIEDDRRDTYSYCRMAEFSDETRLCSFTVEEEMLYHGYINNDKMFIIFNIYVDYIECEPMIDLTKFSSPNQEDNITLVIGDKKLLVAKKILYFRSRVLAEMFNESIENGKNEVELTDVDYEEFLDLLQIVYCWVEITYRMVPHILKLADQFKMKGERLSAQVYLMMSERIDTKTKLALADQYNVSGLSEYCLNTYHHSGQLQILQRSPEYANYSIDMKAAIYERILELGRKEMSLISTALSTRRN